MFGLSKKFNSDADDRTSEAIQPIKSIETQTYRDRRKVSGERVSCQCEFILPSADPFNQHSIKTLGTMVLNVRGCGLYLQQPLEAEDIKRIFPETRLVILKKILLTGSDSQKFSITNLSIRRVRLVTDEMGLGIVMRFVNLNENQLDILCEICDRYAE